MTGNPTVIVLTAISVRKRTIIQTKRIKRINFSCIILANVADNS